VIRLAFRVIFLLAALPLAAQDRELHWRALKVDARLDADGVLHIRERQDMVFTGDWNGGERTFRVNLGQRLHFERLLRLDEAGEHPLTRGDLDAVDQFDWADSDTLRWRSRLPSDAPFDQTPISYVLEYSLSNILLHEDDRYVLDHDFAFPDRVGPIETFELRLDIEPAWDAGRPVPVKGEAGPLDPGETYVVTVPLRRLAAGAPAAVVIGPGPAARGMVAVGFLAALIALAVALVQREKGLGRFEPLKPVETIDEDWLQENVLQYPPEVVGASWDQRTSAPEVAAILARLVAENKIESSVEQTGFGPFKRSVLHMRLLVPRSQLEGYEATLVNALFFSGNETSTDMVRKHYEKQGFDPASKIDEALTSKSDSLLPGRSTAGRVASWKPTAGIAAAGLAVIAIGIVVRWEEAIVAAVAIGIMTGMFVPGFIAASIWRDRVHGLALSSLTFVIPVLAIAGGLLWLLWSDILQTGLWTLVGIACLGLAFVRSILNRARIRERPERIELRKCMAAGREYLRHELRKPAPRLQDAWYPWLIAFGLGSQIDRWFRSFGGTLTEGVSTMSGSPV